jgi:hypothetical protein
VAAAAECVPVHAHHPHQARAVVSRGTAAGMVAVDSEIHPGTQPLVSGVGGIWIRSPGGFEASAGTRAGFCRRPLETFRNLTGRLGAPDRKGSAAALTPARSRA